MKNASYENLEKFSCSGFEFMRWYDDSCEAANGVRRAIGVKLGNQRHLYNLDRAERERLTNLQ